MMTVLRLVDTPMRTVIAVIALSVPAPVVAQFADLANLSEVEQVWLDEHAWFGLPSAENVLIRQGYVISYDTLRRVPRWVAYHVTPAYREVPAREGAFDRFRTDPNVPNPVVPGDYDGLFAARGYARGHLAPYAVMGGDRDGDDRLAEDDDDDARTVFEANSMSNMAPQHHQGFNGSGGLWSHLERWIQDDLVLEGGNKVWVYAGTVFGLGVPETVGPDEDIQVPPMFFKIVVLDDPDPDVETPVVLAFLFPHQRVRHGEIENFLVSVDVVEALTGLDFFMGVGEILEDRDTFENWVGFW